jgi:hypothetical protein
MIDDDYISGIICHDPMMRTLQQSKRNQDIASKMAARVKVNIIVLLIILHHIWFAKQKCLALNWNQRLNLDGYALYCMFVTWI